MNKKDNTLINAVILAVFIILLFLVFNCFMDFKKVSRLSLELSNTLSGLSFFVFILFDLLFLLKVLFPSINNRFVINNKKIQIYILEICIILTLVIPLIIYQSFIGWKSFINPKGRIPRACPWMNE
jgi:hypothetical protein